MLLLPLHGRTPFYDCERKTIAFVGIIMWLREKPSPSISIFLHVWIINQQFWFHSLTWKCFQALEKSITRTFTHLCGGAFFFLSATKYWQISLFLPFSLLSLSERARTTKKVSLNYISLMELHRIDRNQKRIQVKQIKIKVK